MTEPQAIADILLQNPVMPVVVISDASQAIALADALLDGGIDSIEITLRTAEAAASIQAIVRARPQMTVGAGTILDDEGARIAKEAGAAFAVSPGSSASVIAACRQYNLPLLPGAQTATEVMHLRDQGFRYLKFFPATAAGGIPFLKSLHSPIPDVSFCPTGGITPETAGQWLSLPNVVCVGGSWICSARAIAEQDFAAITQSARQTDLNRRSR